MSAGQLAGTGTLRLGSARHVIAAESERETRGLASRRGSWAQSLSLDASCNRRLVGGSRRLGRFPALPSAGREDIISRYDTRYTIFLKYHGSGGHVGRIDLYACSGVALTESLVRWPWTAASLPRSNVVMRHFFYIFIFGPDRLPLTTFGDFFRVQPRELCGACGGRFGPPYTGRHVTARFKARYTRA